MKQLLLMSTVLMVVLILPGLASATHFTDVAAIGDCQGFTAQLDIHFRHTAEFLDLHYEVVVMDDDSMQLTMVSGDMHIVMEDTQDISLMIADTFDEALNGLVVISGTFTITSPHPDGVDVDVATFENEAVCGSVPTDKVNFENVKAMYR